MIAVSDAQIHDVSYFGLLLPQDQKRELAAFATLLDRSKQSYSQENRLYLDHAFADHYDGMLHVMCQVTRYDGAEASFFDGVDGPCSPASRCHKVVVVETPQLRGAVRDADYHSWP
jgi:hypothetical protein